MNKRLNVKMGQLNEQTHDRLNYIRNCGYNVVHVWESDFRSKHANFIKQCEVVGPLAPRDAFYGGRTNCSRLKYDVKPHEQIKYYDFCSLYPFILKYGKFPTHDPEIITSNFDDIRSYYGLVKCTILPPCNLYMPVLPTRLKNNKLVFALCNMCADNCAQTPCSHTEEERALLGTWTTPEVVKALDMGYVIKELHEVWHFPQSSQYDPATHSGGLFSEYINKFFKLKLQYSGWPEGCVTDTQKLAYLDSVLEHEGVSVDINDVEVNPGRRALAKLMLNSFWGKFGQKPNLSKKVVVKTREEFLHYITDDKLIVESSIELSDETLLLTYKLKDDFVEGSCASNVVIAAFTTAQARLKLYDLIYKLGDRVCYFDTDSVFWVDRHSPSDFTPPLGNFLGDVTSELPPGRHITSFISGGPKNYAYQLDDYDSTGMKTKVVIKGISMRFSNSTVATFPNIANKITKYVETGDSTPETFYKTDAHFHRASNFNVYMMSQNKQYRILYDKRVITDNYNTVPYGYKL